MHFNGLKFSGALKEFSMTSQFWGSKINFLNAIRILNAFFRIEEQVISNRLADLKNTKP